MALITLRKGKKYKQVLVLLRRLLTEKLSADFLECGVFITVTKIHSFKPNTLLVPWSCRSVVLFK